MRHGGIGSLVIVGSSSEIRVYQRGSVGGTLVPRAAVTGPGAGAIYGALHPTRDIFYAAHRVAGPVPGGGGIAPTGAISAYSIDRGSGALTRMGHPLVLPLDAPMHLGVSPDGRHLFAAIFEAGAVLAVSTGESGVPEAVVDQKTMAGDRPLLEAHQACVEGCHLFVPCRAGNIVAQLRFDGDGKLTENTPPYVTPRSLGDAPATPAGAGPRHMVIHASRRFAFLVNEIEGTVNVFEYDAPAGRLGDVVQVIKTVPDDAPAVESEAAHPVLHPTDPTLLYVSNRLNPSIDVFEIDVATGMLTRLQHETGGDMIENPRDFAVDADGKVLLVANARSRPDNLLGVFAICQDGTLTPKNSVSSQPDAWFVTVIER